MDNNIKELTTVLDSKTEICPGVTLETLFKGFEHPDDGKQEDNSDGVGKIEFKRTYIDRENRTLVTTGTAMLYDEKVHFEYVTGDKSGKSILSVSGKNYKIKNFKFLDATLKGDVSKYPFDIEDMKKLIFRIDDRVDCFWREDQEAHVAYTEYTGSDLVPSPDSEYFDI